jgi:hypothetical protein
MIAQRCGELANESVGMGQSGYHVFREMLMIVENESGVW